MDGISLRQVKRIVDRGRETGFIVTFNPRNHQPLHYRLDYAVIRQLFESVSVEPPAWVDAPPMTGIQLDQFAEADIGEVLEGPLDQLGEPSDINVTSIADGGESQRVKDGDPSDMDVTSPEVEESSYPRLAWKRGREDEDVSVMHGPLYVHERVNAVEFLNSMLKDAASTQSDMFSTFNGTPEGAAFEPYQHTGNWTNRLIRAPSQRMMASLLEREGMRGKVDMIYMDPRTTSTFVPTGRASSTTST